MSTTLDSIIIGAGFSGLSAARKLTQNAYNVLIIEVRPTSLLFALHPAETYFISRRETEQVGEPKHILNQGSLQLILVVLGFTVMPRGPPSKSWSKS